MSVLEVQTLALLLCQASGLLHENEDVDESEGARDGENEPGPAFKLFVENRRDKGDDEGPEPIHHSVDRGGLVVANLGQVQPDNGAWSELKAKDEGDDEDVGHGLVRRDFLKNPHAEHADDTEDLRGNEECLPAEEAEEDGAATCCHEVGPVDQAGSLSG